MSIKKKSLKRFRDMSAEELTREEQELRTAVWKLKVQRSTGQTADANKLVIARRDLARVLTLLRQREIERARSAAR